jgi:hypothetical protein
MFPITMWSFLLPPNSGFCFAANRTLLGLLFKATGEVVNSWCKEQGLTPGFSSILHTFGSTLNFHPHIHMLFSAGGIDKDGKWKGISFLPWNSWKSRFRAILVKMLRIWVKENVLAIPASVVSFWRKKNGLGEFSAVLSSLFKVTWYVYVGEKLSNADYTVRYIGRYAKRPSVSEAKIVSYDGRNVVFEYTDKLTKEHTRLCLKAPEFIGRLVRHIPEKNFRTIRYGGFYSNRTKEKCEELRSTLPLKYRGVFRFEGMTLSWRERITKMTGQDPLLCPSCGELMKLVEIAYRTRDGPELQIVSLGYRS